MKSEHTTFYNEVIEALQNESLALFAGAGLSMPAGFVDWKGLLKDLAVELGVDISIQNDLLAIAQDHVDLIGGRGVINQKIMKAFSRRVKHTDNHKILAGLNIRTFWTTNFDTLIEDSLRSAGRSCDVVYKVNQLTQLNPLSDVTVYKMHGDVNNAHETVLTKHDFDNYLQEREAFFKILINHLINKIFVFVGISFNDPNVMYVLNKVHELMQDAQRRHWYFIKKVVRKEDQTDEEFNNEKAAQETFIANLRGFSLSPVWVDDYKEITSILQEIEDELIKRELLCIKEYYNDFHDYDRRLSVLQKKYPRKVELLNYCASYYNDNKTHNIEREILERILEFDPTNARILNHLAAILHNCFEDYATAEQLFYRALASDPKFDVAHVNMGKNFAQQGDFEGAKRHYQKALEIRPDYAEAYAGLGRVFSLLSEYEKAITHLDKAIELDPEEKASYYNRAIIYHLHLKNDELAKRDYKKVLDIAPDLIDANMGYGLLLFYNFNNPLEARRYYEKALRINPNHFGGHFYIGLALEHDNIDPIGAQSKFEIVRELNPGFTEVYNHLGLAFSRNAIWEEAKKAFEKAIEVDATDTLALFNLGSICALQFNDYQNAVAYYEKAIEAGLRTYDVYLNLAILSITYLDNKERARELCSMLIDILSLENEYDNETLADIYCQLAGIEVEMDNYVSGRAYLKKSLELIPDNGNAYELLAAVLNNGFKEYDVAREIAEKGLSILPDSKRGRFNYAVILNNLDEHSAALDAINVAIEMDKNDVNCYWKKAEIQGMMEDTEGAKNTLEEGLRVDSSNVDLHYFLIEILMSDDKYYCESLDRMEGFLNIDPDPRRAYSKYAALLNKKNEGILERDIEKTISIIEEGIPHCVKDYIGVFGSIADVFQKKGLLSEAIRYQSKMLEYTTDDDSIIADIHETIGIWLGRENLRNPEVLDHLFKAASIYPHSYTFYNLGVTFAENGCLRKAWKCYLLALKLDPEYEKAKEELNRLGDISDSPC